MHGIDSQKYKESMLRAVVSERYIINPHTFKIIGGLIERIMKSGRDNEQRKTLIWKNSYFSSKKVNHPIPTIHYFYRRAFVLDHPECKMLLKDIVKF
jgi:hypothetical protein